MDLAEAILAETLPSYQATSLDDRNLGFGHIFYALTRVLRPRRVLVIGSKAGFSVICFAVALKDNAGVGIESVGCYETAVLENRLGALQFIDPSLDEAKGEEAHWHGIGFWNDPAAVEAHWKRFGVADVVQHHKCTSAEFLANTPPAAGEIDILYIDGDHSYAGFLHDFTAFYPFLRKDALVLAHDVDPALQQLDPNVGGYRALTELDPALFEVLRIPVFPGLAVARKLAE